MVAQNPHSEALGTQNPWWMTFTMWAGSNSIFGSRQPTVWQLEEQREEQCAQGIVSGSKQTLHAEEP